MFCDVAGGSYASRMRSLAYKTRTVVEETGATNLYLSLGTLVWDWDGKPLRSPLVLVPVTLRSLSKQSSYRLALDESGTSTPNYCLLEKLGQLGIRIPALADPTTDDAGSDLDAALQAVRVAVAEAGRPWRVEPTAHLGILQFAKFRLWKDLDDNWETLLANPLVNHLVHSPTEPFVDPVAQTTATDLDQLAGERPISADASQLQPSPTRCRVGPSCSRARPARVSPRPSPTCWPGPSPRADGCCSWPRSAPPWTWSRSGWTP